MFTVDQIKAAHSLVKSGADFPQYIQDIIKLGVTRYETFVSDSHTVYHGTGVLKTNRHRSMPSFLSQIRATKSNFNAISKTTSKAVQII